MTPSRLQDSSVERQGAEVALLTEASSKGATIMTKPIPTPSATSSTAAAKPLLPAVPNLHGRPGLVWCSDGVDAIELVLGRGHEVARRPYLAHDYLCKCVDMDKTYRILKPFEARIQQQREVAAAAGMQAPFVRLTEEERATLLAAIGPAPAQGHWAPSPPPCVAAIKVDCTLAGTEVIAAAPNTTGGAIQGLAADEASSTSSSNTSSTSLMPALPRVSEAEPAAEGSGGSTTGIAANDACSAAPATTTPAAVDGQLVDDSGSGNLAPAAAGSRRFKGATKAATKATSTLRRTMSALGDTAAQALQDVATKLRSTTGGRAPAARIEEEAAGCKNLASPLKKAGAKMAKALAQALTCTRPKVLHGDE